MRKLQNFFSITRHSIIIRRKIKSHNPYIFIKSGLPDNNDEWTHCEGESSVTSFYNSLIKYIKYSDTLPSFCHEGLKNGYSFKITPFKQLFMVKCYVGRRYCLTATGIACKNDLIELQIALEEEFEFLQSVSKHKRPENKTLKPMEDSMEISRVAVKLYPNTADAVLVSKHFKKDLDSNASLNEIIFSNTEMRVRLLDTAKQMEEALEKKKNSVDILAEDLDEL